MEIWAVILKLLNLVFPDRSKEKVARDDGATSGIAQQKAADQSSVLKDVQDAKAAADAVAVSGVPVTDTDGFRRAD